MALTPPHERLWPTPSSGSGAEFAVLGDPTAAQILVPLDRPTATAASFLRHHAGMGPAERVKRRLAAGVARLGLLKPLMRNRISADATSPEHASLGGELARLLGRDQVWLSVSFGPPRPNQKPVVRVFDKDGHTVAFAKIGWNDLTTNLVEAEAAAVQLSSLRRLELVTVPELIHLGDWNGNRLAVYSAEMGRPGRTTPTWEAFAEVARAWPIERLRLADAPVTRALAEAGDAIPAILERALGRWGDVELEVGGWHGDWTPWNTAARRGGGVVVWDWERAGPGVPLAFDVIHYRFQMQAATGRFPVAELLTDVRSWQPLSAGLTTEAAEATAVWYLMEISRRHAGHNHLTYLEELDRALA